MRRRRPFPPFADVDFVVDANHAGDSPDALDGDLPQKERRQSAAHDHHALIDFDLEHAMRKVVSLVEAANDLLL